MLPNKSLNLEHALVTQSLFVQKKKVGEQLISITAGWKARLGENIWTYFFL
jgi:hypothetical protein